MSQSSPAIKNSTDELPLDIIELAQVLQQLPLEQRLAVERSLPALSKARNAAGGF